MVLSAGMANAEPTLGVGDGAFNPGYRVFVPQTLSFEAMNNGATGAVYVTLGVSGTMFGNIANMPDPEITVDASGANVYLIAGTRGINFSYSHQSYELEATDGNLFNTAYHNSDALGAEWDSRDYAIDDIMRGGLIAGAVYFRDSDRNDVDSFTQTYLGGQFRYGSSVTARMGVSMHGGDVDSDAGYFVSAAYPISDAVSVYADYHSLHFQKLIIHRVILPAAGVDCGGCDDSALSAGIAFKLGNYGHASIGMFDVNDLGAINGAMSLNKNF